MDTNRFDLMTRAFAERRSRRATLKGGVVGLGAAMLGAVSAQVASAQDATPAPAGGTPAAGAGSTGSSFLFVQTASAGTFRTNPDAGTPVTDSGTPTAGHGADYLLTLEHHTGETIYFSDRPERVFGQAPTHTFLDGLGFTPDNPPNAAIVAKAGSKDDDVLVVELFAPAFDDESGTLTYGANVLKGHQAISGLSYAKARQKDDTIAAEFTHASLFIDDCADRDIKCASNAKNVPAGWRGDLGMYPMCWHLSEMSCVPCGDEGWQRTDQDCNTHFPDYCYAFSNVISTCVTDGVS